MTARIYRVVDENGWEFCTTSRKAAAYLAKHGRFHARFPRGRYTVIAPDGSRWRWSGRWGRLLF